MNGVSSVQIIKGVADYLLERGDVIRNCKLVNGVSSVQIVKGEVAINLYCNVAT